MDIASMTLEELEKLFLDMGEKKFRAKQVYEWIHSKFAQGFSDMSNLSLVLRTELDKNHQIPSVKIEKKYEASEEETVKYLFRMGKNTIIESVLMRYSFGNSVCISSQSGCAMGCAFCHSGENGLERNLSAYEMLAQIYRISADIGQRVSNIVIMGSGEPLSNFDNVVKFARIISSDEGANIGKRHITLSTCGIAPQIRKLADTGLGLNLALSLHASNDEIRRKLMPIAESFSIKETIAACDYYAEQTGRRVTYEYALIKGINDSANNAKELAERLKGRLCHVNIIPVNEVPGKEFFRPGKKSIQAFADILNKNSVETTIRRELGSSVNAACGQLKSAYSEGDGGVE